jgi:DNA-binding NtrC family response regulator
MKASRRNPLFPEGVNELGNRTGELNFGRGKILVIDPVINLCLLLEQEFADDGYDVDTATTTEQALKLLESKIYDVVILEVFMKGMELKRILDISYIRNGKVPLIINTTNDNLVDLYAHFQPTGFVQKSSDLSNLKNMVHRIMQDRITVDLPLNYTSLE